MSHWPDGGPYHQSILPTTADYREPPSDPTPIQRGNRDRFGKQGQTNPCKFITTGIGGAKKGEPQIKVRCHCMAPYGSAPWKSFKYDVLGVAHDMLEAKAIWDKHVASLTSCVQEL